jgi:proteasome lid subunit RPN8/RPN11
MIPLTDSHPAMLTLRAHAERDYPREACGVFAMDQAGAVRCVVGRNRAEAPDEFELDAATILRCRRARLEICALYHSHCDAPPGLSPRDLNSALIDGEPAWPGVDLIVNSVLAGRSGHLNHYVWSDAVGRFTLSDAAYQAPT